MYAVAIKGYAVKGKNTMRWFCEFKQYSVFANIIKPKFYYKSRICNIRNYYSNNSKIFHNYRSCLTFCRY